MIASRLSALAVAAIAGCIALASSRTEAQWWRSAPKDFEDCADRAEKAKSKEEKTSQLADCNAKFAGRRKAGGGYTYYDFMQDRSFDIAGPNPTAEEQKKIDQQYTAYLDSQRRDNIANAFAAKQHQEVQQPTPAFSRSHCGPTPKECRCRLPVRSSRPRASKPPTARKMHSRANGRFYRKALMI